MHLVGFDQLAELAYSDVTVASVFVFQLNVAQFVDTEGGIDVYGTTNHPLIRSYNVRYLHAYTLKTTLNGLHVDFLVHRVYPEKRVQFGLKLLLLPLSDFFNQRQVFFAHENCLPLGLYPYDMFDQGRRREVDLFL